jgi:hypothetical protein
MAQANLDAQVRRLYPRDLGRYRLWYCPWHPRRIFDPYEARHGWHTLIQRLGVLQPSLKIIATSGLPTYQKTAPSVGASAFLLKPYDLSDLLSTIADLLREAGQ